MFHSFQTSIAGIELPRLFTYPFHYTPHPLCVMAAGEVQAYINKQTRWKEELDKGKMFGVLIVRTSNGQTGYLAAIHTLSLYHRYTICCNRMVSSR